MKIKILLFLSTIIFISCKKENLFVSCDSPILSIESTKNTLIGRWKLINYCENGEILPVEDDIIWECTDTFNYAQTGISKQLHLIETTNNNETKNEPIELLESDYIQFFFVEVIPYPKRLDLCENEFTLKYIDKQGNTKWAKFFKRI
jgi:hypothetical protein